MIRTKKANPIRDNIGKIAGFSSLPVLGFAAYLVNRHVGHKAVRLAVSLLSGIAGPVILLALLAAFLQPFRGRFRRRRPGPFFVNLALCLLFLCAGVVYTGSIVLWAADSTAGLNTIPRIIVGIKTGIAALPVLWPFVREWFSGLEIKIWHIAALLIALWLLKGLLFGRREDGGSASHSSGGSSFGSHEPSAYADLDYLHDIRKITEFHKTHDIDSYPDPEAPGPDPDRPGPDPEAPLDIHDLW